MISFFSEETLKKTRNLLFSFGYAYGYPGYGSIGNREDVETPTGETSGSSDAGGLSESLAPHEEDDLGRELATHQRKQIKPHHADAIFGYKDDSYPLNKRLVEEHNRATNAQEPEEEVHKTNLGARRRHYVDHGHPEVKSKNPYDSAALDDVTRNSTTHKDMHLFTGISFNPRDKFPGGRIPHEGIIPMPAYTSTSLSKKIATSFAMSKKLGTDQTSHALKIHWPKGSNGVYVGHMSDQLKEKEVILPRGLHLKIHHTPTKSVEGGMKVHTWNAYPVRGHRAGDWD